MKTSNYLEKPDPVYPDPDPLDKCVDQNYAKKMRQYHKEQREKAVKFSQTFSNIRLFDSIDGEGERNTCLYMLCPTKSLEKNQFVLGTTDYGWGTPPEAIQALEKYGFNMYEFLQFDRLRRGKATRSNSPHYTHLTVPPLSRTGKLLRKLFKVIGFIGDDDFIGILPEGKNAIAMQWFSNSDSSFSIFKDDCFQGHSKTIVSYDEEKSGDLHLNKEERALICGLLPPTNNKTDVTLYLNLMEDKYSDISYVRLGFDSPSK